jgi:hypothetical protein
VTLLDRIVRLFWPAQVAHLPPIQTTSELTNAIARAEAVADHVIISADFRKKRAAPLIATTKEAAEQVRRAWGSR